jgi:hypothetical protein
VNEESGGVGGCGVHLAIVEHSADIRQGARSPGSRTQETARRAGKRSLESSR